MNPRYLEYILRFDSEHLLLLRDMLFDRSAWDIEIEEDKPLLQEIENTLQSRRIVRDGISDEACLSMRDHVQTVVKKVINDTLEEQDVYPFMEEWPNGVAGYLVTEELGLMVANLESAGRLIESQELFFRIYETFTKVKAPRSWTLFLIRQVSRTYGMSFTKFQGHPHFPEFANEFRAELRASV